MNRKEDSLITRVHKKESPAVVGSDKKGLVCLTCSYGRHDYSHVNQINKLMDLEQTSGSMFLIVEEHEKWKIKHGRNYAKEMVSTGAITLKTEPLQESVHIGTYSNAVIEDVVRQMYLIPDLTSDN